MLLSWLLVASLQAHAAPTTDAAPACTYVKLDDVVAHPAPAVIVLGERHGFHKDLGRALQVARRLANTGEPVTLALEAVDRGKQGVLDDFAAKKVDVDDLPDALDWKHTWGFSFAAYRPLITASEEGIRVVGVGVPLGPKPEGVEIPIPPRYIDLLRDAMGEHDVPLRQESRFVASMAWRDYALAQGAIASWDGKGYLVVVVGRMHVEGSKGVAWQARQLTGAPISAYVLVPGPNPPCHEGDLLWK